MGRVPLLVSTCFLSNVGALPPPSRCWTPPLSTPSPLSYSFHALMLWLWTSGKLFWPLGMLAPVMQAHWGFSSLLQLLKPFCYHRNKPHVPVGWYVKPKWAVPAEAPATSQPDLLWKPTIAIEWVWPKNQPAEPSPDVQPEELWAQEMIEVLKHFNFNVGP